MQRFAPYLGILAALALGVFLALFSSAGEVVVEHATGGSASSTLSVLSGVSLPSFNLPAFPPAAAPDTESPSVPRRAPQQSGSSAPSPRAAQSPAAPAPSAASAAAPVSPAASPAPAPSETALDSSAAHLREALVNILCYAPPGSPLRSISGSGVVVAPQGLILTNAHVAQYFLLADRGVSCTIRAGGPARDAYTAELAFISPAWVRANASLILQSAPVGTGEEDYAFLAISGSLATSSPAAVPFVRMAAVAPTIGTPVAIASYGAQYLDTAQVQSSLFPTVVLGSVKNLFTFGVSTIDVLDLGGSAVAQEGSSGGGVAREDGALVGTITTSSIGGPVASRSLNAITTSYIRADYASETGSPLEFLLGEATSTAVANFFGTRVALEALLLAVIGN